MYKHDSFYEIYDHQLLETQVLKSEEPKAIGFYLTQCNTKPESWLDLYLGLSRR